MFAVLPFALALLSFCSPGFGDIAFDLTPVCGSAEGDMINITYSGSAHSIYPADNPLCTFTETDLLDWIYTDINSTCGLKTAGSTKLYYVDIVVQQSYIRQLDDPVYTVSCNYNLGVETDGDQNDMAFEKVQKTPKLVQVQGAPTGNTSLEVQDVRGNPLTRVVLGQYIRLVSTLVPGVNESAIRVWNCKAFGSDPNSPFWLLISGCGEGTVIGEKKGFNTVSLTSSGPYFRAFSLPGESSVVFGCSYIICSNGDAGCDGSSCTVASRKRRALSADHLETSANEVAKHQATPYGIRAPIGTDGLPIVYSTYISVVRETEHNLSPEDLLTADDPFGEDVRVAPGTPVNNVYLFVGLGLLLIVAVIVIITVLLFRRMRVLSTPSEAYEPLHFKGVM